MVRRTRENTALQDGTGEALFLTHLGLIDQIVRFVCARFHVPSIDAEDFSSHVKLKLVEDDYAILRTFEGRSTIRTFLTIVIQRLFLDYRTSAWGKWRPSAEARRNGGVAMLLEELVVRDGHPFDEACELMWTNHKVALPRHELESLMARLPSRSRRRLVSEEELEPVAAAGPSPDDVLIEHERGVWDDKLSDTLRGLVATLETQDRLILTMRFEDGKTVREIADVLHLEYKPLFRRVARLLAELRKTLEAQGIDGTSVP